MTDLHDHHQDGDFASDFKRIMSRRVMLTGLGLAGVTGLVGVSALAQGHRPMSAPQPDVTATGADGQVCIVQHTEIN